MTRYRQAHRPAPIWVALVGGIGYLFVAAGIAFAIWFLLSAFLGMGTYIESVAP